MAREITFERGFLPEYDPLVQSPHDFRYYDDICSMIPDFAHGKTLRKVISGLPEPTDRMLESLTSIPQLERMMLVFSNLSAAFVQAPGEKPSSEANPLHIPRNIAVPHWKIARKLGKIPILSYDTYEGQNWERINPEGPIALGNLRSLMNFSEVYDEDWFKLVHTEIEALAGRGLAKMDLTQYVLMGIWRLEPQAAGVFRTLTMLGSAERDMYRAFLRLPDHCRPGIYDREVRPWIFGNNHVFYDGIPVDLWRGIPGVVIHDDGSVTLRGETGAQSSVIPTILAWLGIVHTNSFLTDHLNVMRAYMPPEHRDFIEGVEERNLHRGSIREFVKRHPELIHVAWAYDKCIAATIDFLVLHHVYAIFYIQKWVRDPMGTGGTPYMKFLGEHIEEVRDHIIHPETRAKIDIDAMLSERMAWMKTRCEMEPEV